MNERSSLCVIGPNMLSARATEVLLSKLCIKLGFCLPKTVRDQFVESPHPRPEDFANAVFVAEGLDPQSVDRHLYRQVLSMVVEAFALEAPQDPWVEDEVDG